VRTASSSPPLTSLNKLPRSVILFLALIFSLVTYRRRRAAQANLAYVVQGQPQGGNVYNAYGGQPPYAPQYPPQAHGGPGGVPDYAYDPNAGYAPVRPTSSPPFVSS